MPPRTAYVRKSHSDGSIAGGWNEKEPDEPDRSDIIRRHDAQSVWKNLPVRRSRRPFLSSAELRGKCKSGCGWAIRFRSCSIGRLFVREYPSATKPIWDGVYRSEWGRWLCRKNLYFRAQKPCGAYRRNCHNPDDWLWIAFVPPCRKWYFPVDRCPASAFACGYSW